MLYKMWRNAVVRVAAFVKSERLLNSLIPGLGNLN